MGRVETEINRRAIEGTDKPVIYQGKITGSYKEFSDNLLMFRAKRLDPSYRDNYNDRSMENTPVVTQINIIAPPGAVARGAPKKLVFDGGAKTLPDDVDAEAGSDREDTP